MEMEGVQYVYEDTHRKIKGIIIRYRCKSYVLNDYW